jgi:hypothetical protein
MYRRYGIYHVYIGHIVFLVYEIWHSLYRLIDLCMHTYKYTTRPCIGDIAPLFSPDK